MTKFWITLAATILVSMVALGFFIALVDMIIRVAILVIEIGAL